MSPIVDEMVAQLLGETAGLAKAAANKLKTEHHPYYPDKSVYVVNDGRHYVGIHTPIQEFNPLPLQKVRKSIIRGWRMNSEPFFLSQQGHLMINWKNTYYATVACSMTVATVSFFFSEPDIKQVTDELIDLVAPY